MVSRATPSPSSFGISISSKAMSGCKLAISDRAVSPSPASATTFSPGSSSTLSRKPLRISGWSSAMRIEIVSFNAFIHPSVQQEAELSQHPNTFPQQLSFDYHVEPHGPLCSVLYVPQLCVPIG